MKISMKIGQKLVLAFLLTTTVVILSAWFFRPSPHLLQDKASKVSGIRLGYHGDDYFWLSGHSLLVFHWSAVHWDVVRRDTQTSVETPLPQLNAFFQQTGGDPGSVKVSLDDRRLLWAGKGKIIYGATVEGANFQHWPYAEDETGISYWLADNRHFLRYRGNPFFDPRPTVLRSVETPGQVKHLPLDWQQQEVRVSEELAPLLAAPNRIYVEASTHDSHYHDVALTVTSFGTDKVRQRVREVPLPPEFSLANDSNPRFLSDEQRLIWSVNIPSVSHVPLWLKRLMTRFRLEPKPSSLVGVYTSQADGTHWRFIGDWPEPPNLQFYQEQEGAYPLNFRWMPGDRQISFECKASLYTVPVD